MSSRFIYQTKPKSADRCMNSNSKIILKDFPLLPWGEGNLIEWGITVRPPFGHPNH